MRVKQIGPITFVSQIPHQCALCALLFASKEPVWCIFQAVCEVLFLNFSIHIKYLYHLETVHHARNVCFLEHYGKLILTKSVWFKTFMHLFFETTLLCYLHICLWRFHTVTPALYCISRRIIFLGKKLCVSVFVVEFTYLLGS